MNPELEFILDMELLDEVAGDADTLLPEGVLSVRIKHAAFYYRGTKIDDENSSAVSLFLATPEESEFRRTGKQTCRDILRPLDSHSFSLSNVLVAQLSLGRSSETLDWHRNSHRTSSIIGTPTSAVSTRGNRSAYRPLRHRHNSQHLARLPAR
jgi:hypothetical protein